MLLKEKLQTSLLAEQHRNLFDQQKSDQNDDPLWLEQPPIYKIVDSIAVPTSYTPPEL